MIKTVVGYSLILALTLAGGFLLIREHLSDRWPFLVEIEILVLSALLFFLFSAGFVWRYVFIIVFSVILFSFLLNIFQLLYQPRFYRPHGLKKMGLWLNFFIAYCCLVGLGAIFGSDVLSGGPFLAAGVVFLLISWLNFYFFWLNGEVKGNGEIKNEIMDFSLVISLILAEIYLVINFLPFGFYLNALIVAIIFVIISIGKAQRNFKLYL